MRYYIADLHFFHEDINTQMDCRGFSGIEEMHDYMIEKWNSRVRINDEAVIIGDFSWGNVQQTKEILARMHGKMYLIQGNHDRFLRDTRSKINRFKWIKPYAEMKDNKRKVVLCHYPIMFYHKQYRLDEEGNPTAYMLHGHVHDTQDQRLLERFEEITRRSISKDPEGNPRNIPCNMINCFCGYSDYVPLTLDEWIEVDRERKEMRRRRREEIRKRKEARK